MCGRCLRPIVPTRRGPHYQSVVLAGLEQAQYLAGLAIEETRLGLLEEGYRLSALGADLVQLKPGETKDLGDVRVRPQQ